MYLFSIFLKQRYFPGYGIRDTGYGIILKVRTKNTIKTMHTVTV